jgi:hypothetical protein
VTQPTDAEIRLHPAFPALLHIIRVINRVSRPSLLVFVAMTMLAVFGGEHWAFAGALVATASNTCWWLYWHRRARALLAQQVSTLPAVQQRAWELALLAAQPRLVSWLREGWQRAIEAVRALFRR